MGEHILAEWFAEWLLQYDDNPWIAAHAMASVGAVAFDPTRPVTTDQLIREVDASLYQAKSTGKARVSAA